MITIIMLLTVSIIDICIVYSNVHSNRQKFCSPTLLLSNSILEEESVLLASLTL